MLEDLGESDEAIPIPNVSASFFLVCSHIVQDWPCSFLCHRSTRPSCERWSNGALTTRTTLPAPVTTMTPAARPPTSTSGTKNSCRLTRRCFLRSFWYAGYSGNVGSWSLANNFPPQTGRQLSRYQGPTGRWLQDSRQHDQGQVAWGDPQDLQHPERFHSRRGGSNPPRERVGWRVSLYLSCYTVLWVC